MSILSKNANDALCLCGSGQNYESCCLAFHTRKTYPETTEQLMRSRYTAYALHLKNYLLETWDISTRPGEFEFDNGLTWKSLIIGRCKKGRLKDQQGWVSFTASYQVGLDRATLQEKSYFIRDGQGHWCYVDGEFNV
jgi:SEC-C motif-containing protein